MQRRCSLGYHDCRAAPLPVTNPLPLPPSPLRPSSSLNVAEGNRNDARITARIELGAAGLDEASQSGRELLARIRQCDNLEVSSSSELCFNLYKLRGLMQNN